MIQVKLSRITNHIYARGHTKKRDTPDVMNALREEGITVVVNVSPTIDPHLCQQLRAAGGDYYHLPMIDGPRVQEQLAAHCASIVVRHVRDHRGVLVHCNQGRNRTGLVIGLALVELMPEAAPHAIVAQMREARSGLLANEVFADYVRTRR